MVVVVVVVVVVVPVSPLELVGQVVVPVCPLEFVQVLAASPLGFVVVGVPVGTLVFVVVVLPVSPLEFVQVFPVSLPLAISGATTNSWIPACFNALLSASLACW